MFRNFYCLLTIFCLKWGCLAFGQSWKEAKSNAERLIEEGQYVSVAQLEGPKLIANFSQQAEAHYLYSYALYLTGDFDSSRIQLNQAITLSSEISANHLWLEGLLEAASYNLDPSTTTAGKSL